MISRYSRFLWAAATGLLVVSSPADVLAQGGEGYLFKQPMISISLRAGLSMPRAGSDLFAFTTEELTVEKNDFNAPVLEGRIAVRVNDRVDLMATVGGGSSTTRSEFREWEGSDGLPIEQTTTFSMVHFTLGARAYLTDRGRAVGSLAWIPAKITPYVGAEAGWIFHEFLQEGEFVDYDTFDVFNDYFRSEGTAPTVQALAGVDYSINNRVMLTTEARYGWANDELGIDFVGFEALDLSGFQVTAGFTVRF